MTTSTKSAQKDDDAAAKREKARTSFWLREIEKAAKREKSYRKLCREILKIYEAEKEERHQYNILYSNVETLGPALYNSMPRPEVKRRYNDADPLGKAASELCERTLSFLLDSDLRDYEPFGELMHSAVQEGLIVDRGLTRFKFDAKVSIIPAMGPSGDGERERQAKDEGEAIPRKRLDYAAVCGEVVSWDRFLHGYAKRWKDVPWVAFLHPMTLGELEDNFGKETAAEVELSEARNPESDSEEEGGGSDEEEGGGKQLADVWEIWDKATRKVIFVSPGYPDAVLKEVADPLKLSGFFPCPRPLMPFRRVTSLCPVPLYSFYKEQAEELNRVTVRINKITNALKVRGFYDSQLDGLPKVLAADDNELIPIENVAALGNGQGNALEKAILLMPIEKLVTVLQQLYAQREQVKQVIYEITGIADIMRGSTQASETLGAQEIKNQWGTLRLKRAQAEVARYARDCLRIMAEIAMSKLPPKMLKQMTGLPFPLAAEKQAAQATAQAMQMAGQAPKEDLLQVLSMPSFEDLQQLLSNDLLRSFRIDIETNSTVDLEATEDKEDMAELMNALSQFLNGVAPLIENGTMPFPAAKSILLGLVRRFRLGRDIEDDLAAMQPPQGASPEALQQQQAELEKRAQELDKQQQDVAAAAKELDFAQKEFQQEQKFAKKELDMELKFAQKSLDQHAQEVFATHAQALDGQRRELDFERQSFIGEQKITQTQAKLKSDADRGQAQKLSGQLTKLSPEAIAQPILEGLREVFDTFGQQLVAVIDQKLSAPKRAKKLPDGTWTTF